MQFAAAQTQTDATSEQRLAVIAKQENVETRRTF